MTPADHLDRAIAHLDGVEASLQAAAYGAPDQRRQLKGELASNRATRDRLRTLRNRKHAECWKRLIAITSGLDDAA